VLERRARRSVGVCGALLGSLLACGEGEGSPATGTGTGTGSTSEPASGAASSSDTTGPAVDETGSTGAVPFEGRLVVTADWLGRTLSLLDYDALVAGATTRDEMLVGTIDLSAYAPGPLELEITPDGRRAVVSVSPGFFGGFVGTAIGAGSPEQDGTLLVVDLQTREVLAELDTAHVPMGIAISPDGTRAYTANYGLDDGGSTMSVIDLEALAVIEDIEVGQRPEQVALDDAGEIGMLNLASDGTVRAFSTSDPAGTLSTPLPTSDDPSDIAFIPGTTLAVVSNSIGPSSWAIVDVADPAAPVLVEDAPPPGGAPYAVSHVPGTSDVILVTTDFAMVHVLRIDTSTIPSTIVWTHDEPMASFPLSAAIAGDDGLVIVDAPGENRLLVLGLDGTGARTIEWLETTGPTYVAVAPE
jgi:YVTN family beta-propeller protein